MKVWIEWPVCDLASFRNAEALCLKHHIQRNHAFIDVLHMAFGRITDLVDDRAYRLSVDAEIQPQYAKQSDPGSAGNPETIHFHNHYLRIKLPGLVSSMFRCKSPPAESAAEQD